MMERINISIETTNSAFYDSNYELARILRDLAEKFEGGITPNKIKDINGNVVGQVDVYE